MAGGTGFIDEECVSNILGSALVSPPRDRAMINCRRDKKAVADGCCFFVYVVIVSHQKVKGKKCKLRPFHPSNPSAVYSSTSKCGNNHNQTMAIGCISA